jgi:hypothetical protein
MTLARNLSSFCAGMKLWPLAICCLACLGAAGCRTRPVVALLERENRELEDRLYELADRLEDCRRDNARLHSRLERDQDRAGQPALAPPTRWGEPAQPPAEEQLDFPRLPDEIRSPTIEVPEGEISGKEFLERQKQRGSPDAPKQAPGPSGQEAPRWAPPDTKGGTPTSETGASYPADNTQVALITLNDLLTGGFDLDARSGHEGITTVIEPRDAAGRVVHAAAPVSVVVLDLALVGEAARVARWDFTADEIARLYRKTPLSRGIHLELVWPDGPPIHGRLQMFVRYVTDDGRRLEAKKELEVEVSTLEAQHSPRRLNEPTVGSRTSDPPWQAPSRLPADEPARTASVPAGPRLSPSHAPLRPSRPKRPRPLWSPHRP